MGLDTALDEITSGVTDNDVVFDIIEWAERCDSVPALIQAAAEYNDQNRLLQQLKQDASAWFAPASATLAAETRLADSSAPPTAIPPSYSAGGDVIVANIGSGSENIAVGKNVQQSDSASERRKKQ
jgi:hypothetical protein